MLPTHWVGRSAHTPLGSSSPEKSAEIYVGKLLNAPHGLSTVKEGDLIRFLAVPGLPHPLHVTSGYLRERPHWGVTPCDKCGASECFDPPTVMARTRFPGMSPESEQEEPATSPPEPPRKPWWKFW
jgi:hypothetical protein